MLDISMVKEALDPEDVLECLGVEFKPKGKLISILCPFHNDQNFGSAFVRKDSGKFTCYSCGQRGDVFDIAMAVKKCSFSEAADFIADSCGGVERFNISDSEEKLQVCFRKSKLTPKEQCIIGIPADINIKQLYFFNADMYRQFITMKAKDAKEKYKNLLKNIGSRDAPNAIAVYKLFNGQVDSNTYRNISSEIKYRISVCEEILERLA